MSKLFLYNTLTRGKEEFKPIKDKEVGLYTCGPTVYEYAHIGNFRYYIFTDILRRVLEYNKYKVKHVMNITDVGHLTGDRDMGEDKLEKGAKREGKTAWEIAEFYTKTFKEDMVKLNILEPSVWCKATDNIQEQIDLIKVLESKGYIYKTSDGVYFNTAKFKDYTKLSRQKLETLQEGARVEKNEEKKNPTDFALWKFSPEGEKRHMEWYSPWGKGFPGWHIECSAMSMKFLGDQLDIHCGGIDHIDIHHTNEIAQSEAATGKQFFNFWMHGAFLNIAGGKKMAKSEENFLTLENAFIKKSLNPLTFRFATLQTHYRKPMEYSQEGMENAQEGLRSLYNQISDLGHYDNQGVFVKISGHKYIDKEYKDKFLNAINDDLNMPQALAIVQELLNSDIPKNNKLSTILEFDKVLGIDLKKGGLDTKKIFTSSISSSTSSSTSSTTTLLPKEDNIDEMIKKRTKAREKQDYNESDKLRKEIEKLGYILEDNKDGFELKFKISKILTRHGFYKDLHNKSYINRDNKTVVTEEYLEDKPLKEINLREIVGKNLTGKPRFFSIEDMDDKIKKSIINRHNFL